MPEFLAGLSLAEYTPTTIAILCALLVFFGKLVPEKTTKKIEALYKDALSVERENSRAAQESLYALIEQNELSLEVLKKLPEPVEPTTTNTADNDDTDTFACSCTQVIAPDCSHVPESTGGSHG